MFVNFPSILVTKLYAPRLRSSYVARAALLEALDTALDRKLLLIAAAAGFGKTTLVAQWSSQHKDDVSWLSLDEEDNDPARFLSYVIAAIETRRPTIGQELLAALQSPQPPSADKAMPILINQLAASRERLIVVLDDYHTIENPAIHAAVSFLLDHLPLQMNVILLTRTDPPLPLARLRAKNELLELRAANLRFSADEAERFLNETMRLGLSAEAISALETRTEGWIAGLQLAALAMQTPQGDRQAFVQSFTGSHRFVLDYLIEEVLSRQPENIRRFLLQTSILSRLNGALCDAVLGENGGQATIDYLERNNLFLIPLDQAQHWYRYHHLFADLLQAYLQAEYPTLLSDLRRRAAVWHAQNGFPEEAIGYALAAGDFEYAADIINGPGAGITQRGEVITLLEWFKTFPPEFLASHPRLCLQFGLAFALNGRWDEAESLLSAVEQHPDVQAFDTAQDSAFPLSEVLMLSYLVASYRQNAARLEWLAARAAAVPRPDRITKLVLALIVSLSGDLRRGCQLMAEAQEASEREGDTSTAFTALFHQCRLHVFLGNLKRAHELCQLALERVRQAGGATLPYATLAHTALGRILIEWNELDEAGEHLSQAMHLCELSGFVTGVMSSSMMMLGEVKRAQGDSDEANRAAEMALVHAERNDPPPEVFWLRAYQARIWLTQGNTSAATGWMGALTQYEQSQMRHQQQAVSLFYPMTIQKLTQARVLLAERKLEQAITLLTKLSVGPRDLLTVEVFCVLAMARQAQGDSVHAALALEQALLMAEPENHVRPFLDMGRQMAKLLARFIETQPDHGFAKRLLGLFPTMADERESQLVEPFSDRELDVLRLIVAGQSNDEIAQTLTIALSTVKWYVNTLYSKLHVKTRSQAIARVHELKLFG